LFDAPTNRKPGNKATHPGEGKAGELLKRSSGTLERCSCREV